MLESRPSSRDRSKHTFFSQLLDHIEQHKVAPPASNDVDRHRPLLHHHGHRRVIVHLSERNCEIHTSTGGQLAPNVRGTLLCTYPNKVQIPLQDTSACSGNTLMKVALGLLFNACSRKLGNPPVPPSQIITASEHESEVSYKTSS